MRASLNKRAAKPVAPAELRFPKPQGAIAKEWSRERWVLAAVASPTTAADRLLEWVLEAGDYLRTPSTELCPAGVWLLVPMPWTLVELLNQAGSAESEREADDGDGAEPEETDDDQVDDEYEEEGDDREDLEGDHQGYANPTVNVPAFAFLKGKTI